MLRLLDLFSGIGGFSLGLERSGAFKTVAFCEIEPFCRKVLKKHWPDVPIYEDIRTLTAERLRADGIAVDAICGGFPCTDISLAGKGAGIEGPQSGLWSEYARIIGYVRPRYVIIENVSALIGRGLLRVLGDLTALRYDTEWSCICASDVGAPHKRDRIWIVAYPNGEGEYLESVHDKMAGLSALRHTNGSGLAVTQTYYDRPPILSPTAIKRADWWTTESDVVRMVHGVSNRVDRIRALGNAVVPQIPEIIGRAIAAAEASA